MHLYALNAVSVDKGCYIGQELTQRTFHTGVIRRIALPFVIDSSPVTLEEGRSVKINVDNFAPMEMIDHGFDMDIGDH